MAYAIGSPWSQAWLGDTARGVAYTGINIRDLKRLPLPLPPLGEQLEIVRIVRALFACAETIGSRIQNATERAERLERSILERALGGKLVPAEAELARREGREYESAAELVERISTGRGRAAAA